ncbi:MAG TPA: AAA-like domain-containing protein [Gammaproteobacteria bacterium]
MPKVAQPGEYFVVGGPVQPDRACYVERAADAELLRGIGEQRFCHVLAARSTGKSSLMARAIRALRRDGQLAAVVDLSQIAAHSEAGAAARWYYAIAYRVLRELRVKFDLQGWWQEKKSALAGEQRLAEFFVDVVLTHTSVPVTVFIDEIERTLALPFARDLFATIHSCYARRVSDPDFGRLNFVVLGVASPAELCPDTSLSPFIDGLAIEPADFTLEQSLLLAPGLGGDPEVGRAVLERIHEWAGGQPYLTQRIARGVARRGGRVDDVERVVREQFLAPGAAEKDPYLNRIRLTLTRRGSRPRQALSLLARLDRDAPVPELPHSPPKELLRLAGVTGCTADGRLRYRNRILREVFGNRWLAQVRPFEWRRAGAIAAVAAAAVVVPVWYSQILPKPYLEALRAETAEPAAAEDAYEKLHRLPGFASIADRLLADAMTRRSRSAESYAEMIEADRLLRRLPGQAQRADRLAGEYWLRRASDAMHAERRDDALLLALEALEAGAIEARPMLAELIGPDFARLRETFRFPSVPVDWVVDWGAGEVSVVDKASRALRFAFTPAGRDERTERTTSRGGAEHPARAAAAPRDDAAAPTDAAASAGATAAPAPAPSPLRLTALQPVPIQREIGVDEPGLAGAFRLDLRLRHERPDDLLIVLTAPGGAEARLTLDGRDPSARSHSFRATDASPLAALGGAERRGVWRLTVVDRRSGAAGTLLDWSLSFSGTPWAWRDAPAQGLAIPDPGRTEQIEAALSADGRYAAVRAARRQGPFGALAIWDLDAARLVRDLETAAAPDFVAFNGDASRVLARAGSTVTLWDVATGRSIARIEAQNGFSLPPAFSVDGDFVALAKHGIDAGSHAEFVRVADGALIASAPAVEGARAWVLGPSARYAAVVEAAGRVVRVFDPRRPAAERRLHHERDVERLVAAPSGDWVLTVDTLGDIRAWRIPIDLSRPGSVDAFRVGTTSDAGSVAVSGDGSLVAFAAPQGHVVVRELVEDGAAVHVRVDAAGRVETRLGPDGRLLATLHPDGLRLWDLESGRMMPGADPNLSALAIDAAGAVAALGYRGGHVRVRSASELARPGPRADTIDYIGHRGHVTSLDVDASRALIASGGADGLVRIWDLASVAPTKHFMRHPAGPVEAVELSPDGRWVASGGDYVARVWSTDDGELAAEVTVNGTALAVAFAPDASRWAVGDSAGNVFVAARGSGDVAGSVRAQGPVRALAFAPDGRVLASGDDTGHVELWDTTTFAPVAPRRAFAHPIRWVGFTPDGSAVLIQTERWIHRAAVDDGHIRVLASRLLPAGVAAGAALAQSDGSRVRVVGGLGAGPIAFHDLSFAEPAPGSLPASDPLLARDWRRALGLEISSDGDVVPILQ